jgi:hypothetical protein
MGAGMAALHLLMEQLAIPLMRLLAIPLSNQRTVAKWLVISQQAGKWLVIPQSAGYAITSDLARVVCEPSRMAITNDLAVVSGQPSQMASSFSSCFTSNVPARSRPTGAPLLRSDPFALSEVRP